MDQERKNKPTESKNRPSMAFFLILVTVGIAMLALMMINSIREYRLSYSHFDRLLEETMYQDANGDAQVLSESLTGAIRINNVGLKNVGTKSVHCRTSRSAIARFADPLNCERPTPAMKSPVKMTGANRRRFNS